MKELQRLADIYNERQEKISKFEWRVINCEDIDNILMEKTIEIKNDIIFNFIEASPGLYEWLFNPKYKALEIFRIEISSDLEWIYYYESETVPLKICKYILNEVKK